MSKPILWCLIACLAGCANPSQITPATSSPNQPTTPPNIQINASFWVDKVQHRQKSWLSHPQTFSLRLEQIPASHVLELLAKELRVGYDMDACGEARVSLVGQDMTIQQITESLQHQSNSSISMQGKQLLMRCQTDELRIYHLDYLATSRNMTDSSSLSSAISNAHRDLPLRNETGNRSELTLINNQTHDIWQNIALQIEQLIGAAAKQNEVTTRERQVNEVQDRNFASRRNTPQRATRPERLSATAMDTQRSDVTTTRKEYRSGQVIVHPESASIAVLATPAEHQRVVQWLDQLQVRVNRQIVIEAVITEITLNERYERGIDWNVLRQNGLRAGLAVQGLNTGTTGTLLHIGKTTTNSDASIVLRLLEEFGKASVLSSPRVVTMNQQPAVLKVIDNRVYFTTDVQTSAPTLNSPAFSTFTTQVQTVPVGFLMTVTPQISEDQTIQLRVRPTLSRIVGFVRDPNPALKQLDIVSEVPEIQTRELESILRLRSGEMALLGGLRQQENRNLERGIPGSPDALNTITQSITRESNHIELVILLKASSVDAPAPIPRSSALPPPAIQGSHNELERQLGFALLLYQNQQVDESATLLQLLHEAYPRAPEPAYNLSLLWASEAKLHEASEWLDSATQRCATLECDLPLLPVKALISTQHRQAKQ
ncbi:MAG TPA: hypothetical protein VFV43_01085 [Limnobacter sp.]|nr:hypothetical protein [Limnobacter sp.]